MDLHIDHTLATEFEANATAQLSVRYVTPLSPLKTGAPPLFKEIRAPAERSLRTHLAEYPAAQLQLVCLFEYPLQQRRDAHL